LIDLPAGSPRWQVQRGLRSDTEADRGLRYLKRRFPEAEAWQLSATGSKEYRTPDGIRVSPALTFLRTLA